MIYNGLNLCEDPYLYTTTRTQVRFPRSKKVRMRRKWAKNEKNWRTTVHPKAYQVGTTIFAHPMLAQQIRQQLRLI